MSQPPTNRERTERLERSKQSRIARLRSRLRTVSDREAANMELIAVVKGVLDLLEDEL